MSSLIVWWIVIALSVWAASRLVEGFSVKSTTGLLVVAAIFGVLNWLLAEAMLSVGTALLRLLPLAVPAASFVLHWLITALLLWFTHKLTDQLEIKSFPIAVIAALVISVVGFVAQLVLGVVL